MQVSKASYVQENLHMYRLATGKFILATVAVGYQILLWSISDDVNSR